ncbi:MAG: NAD-dependent epimerase/dehydratase family protein, partial [Symploca sp. SIO1B1]|nr:NAD-dependent epimerase/dehydratase family protein [Symploca sp. SIO1B1]
QLPEYMVPSAFVTLDTLPLTPNGKVDHKALPTPYGTIIREHEYVAPHTTNEEIIANIFAEVLGVQNVGIYDNFFELGGHSLIATQLILRLRQSFEVEIPLREVFESPNVYDLAKLIEHLVIEKDYTSEPIDLEAEARLDQDIQLSGTPIQLVEKPQSIFLTGATGFLGIYLLHELLQTTSATIYCLVRSVDLVSGRQRLESKLRSYNLWHESFISRIIPVVGDLVNRRFGLSTIEYDTLAEKIDVIYHNGAYVNHLWSYNLLKQVNAMGTQEVLRLASKIKIKPVHYVSTVGVFPTRQSSQPIIESETLSHPQELQGGYSQSKWVAEKIVWEAANRGLPVSIYRPSRITGHSQTGMSNLEDLFSRFVKGCILLKSAPILNNFRDNLVPVDYVSRAIVHLSQQNNSFGKAFHLANPESTPLSNIYNWIRLLGYPIEEIDYDHWRSRMMKDTENPLYPYLVIFPQVAPEFQWLEYDCHNVLSVLAGTDIEPPKVDKKLFRTYISYFNDREFLELP